MGLWGTLTRRWALYAIAAAAFVLGLLRVRSQLLTQGEDNIRRELAFDTLRRLREAREVENEVEALDAAALRDRARKWVR
jgi:bacteriorhodopsin